MNVIYEPIDGFQREEDITGRIELPVILKIIEPVKFELYTIKLIKKYLGLTKIPRIDRL